MVEEKLACDDWNEVKAYSLGPVYYKRSPNYDFYYLFDVSSIVSEKTLFTSKFDVQSSDEGKLLITDKTMMFWLSNNDSFLTDSERSSLYHAFMRVLSIPRTKEKKEVSGETKSVEEYVKWRAEMSQQKPIGERMHNTKNPFLYIDRFLRKDRLHAVLQYKVFPNIKEVSESMSAYYAVMNCLRSTTGRSKFGDPTTKCYVVADGSTPRTGAIFALSTNWLIYSIDPVMKTNNGAAKKLERLSCHQSTAEDFVIPEQVEGALSVVVAVHSHANFNDFWQRLPTPKIGVAIPCCVEQSCDDLQCQSEYDDLHMLSAANHIKTWCQF
ncbi:hypothetical protein AKO1_000842 [Acrasis kona]|uniref:Uncharacterized protein n=1 Tax=Acrasis kona TaxID=1008807 RepID=A0AAW2ZE45_9EUKA